LELDHCSFYRWHVVVAGHGDSMVAVYHDVGFLELVEVDRRQVFCTVERSVYALPPLPQAGLRGQEGSVELILPPHATEDLLHLYYPRPSVEAIVSHKLSSVVFEGKQSV
jgi:hypothetical protein